MENKVTLILKSISLIIFAFVYFKTKDDIKAIKFSLFFIALELITKA